MPLRSTCTIRSGVYTPVLTPFKDDGSEDVDIEAFKSSISRIAGAGVGVLIGGTLGEGPLLSREERKALVACAKEIVKTQIEVPVIAGVTGASVRECVSLAQDAAISGADAVYMSPPLQTAIVYTND